MENIKPGKKITLLLDGKMVEAIIQSVVEENNPVGPIIRYIRPRDKNNTILNHGGVTIAATIDYRTNKIKIAHALCSKNDNFSKIIGQTIAKERLKAGESVSLNYNPKRSITEHFLQTVVENKDDFANKLHRIAVDSLFGSR
jgi:hypothetical protein